MKKTLAILHGALGSSEQFSTIVSMLEKEYNVATLDFEGHGVGKSNQRPYRMEYFAENVIDFLNKNSIEKSSIFGYSMGGYVGLYCALHFPERVNSVVTLGTKFYWTPEYAASEVKKLNPDIIEQKLPAFAEILKNRHSKHDWRNVLEKTAEMMIELGNNPCLSESEIGRITIPLCVGVADKDNMVTASETEQLAKSNEKASFYVLPQSYHPIEKTNNVVLVDVINSFCVV